MLTVGGTVRADVESLIEQEQAVWRDWMSDGDRADLPPVWLLGDRGAVELYADSTYGGKPNPLCRPLPFDELIELSRSRPGRPETTLNLRLPRVREVLERTCLARPGDVLVAVGPGWQKRVRLQEFVVRRERALCPEDSPYALWATLDEPLPETPLFFTSDERVTEGENRFRLPEASTAAIRGGGSRGVSNLASKLEPWIPFLEEYDVDVRLLADAGAATLVEVRKKKVLSDDGGLPHQAVFALRDENVRVLALERVDPVHGSGRVRIEGLLDFNGDGRTDVVIAGFHRGCPYRLVYEGADEGFTRVEAPKKPCHC